MLGATLAWQLVFFLIASDPVRYRPLMLLAAIFEKSSYGIAILVLYGLGRIPGLILGFGLLDLIYAALFVAAYLKTTKSVVSEREFQSKSFVMAQGEATR